MSPKRAETAADTGRLKPIDVSYPLSLADYPLGHMIALQVREQKERAGSVAPSFVRMAVTDDVVPDLWMT